MLGVVSTFALYGWEKESTPDFNDGVCDGLTCYDVNDLSVEDKIDTGLIFDAILAHVFSADIY